MTEAQQQPADRELVIEQFVHWAHDPVAFVLDNFGPGYEALHGEPLVPDPWQVEALAAVAKGDFLRFAFAASKNALKTCTLAWIILWWLFTRVNAQIVCVSVTGANLKSGLWKELSTWFALSPLLQSMFSFSGEQIVGTDPDPKVAAIRREQWWVRARSFKSDADASEQKEALAGLHGPAMMFVADEAGGVPDGVAAAADAIHASEGCESRTVLAGNTVRQSGPLYRAVLNREGLWWVKRISGDPADPNRCTRVSVKWAQDQLAMCGGDRNHPHYKINVLGEFPDVASDKLLGPDDVDKAMVRNPHQQLWEHEPIIVGIDTALQGTDETVLIKRQGCVAFRPRVWRTKNVMTLADQIAAELIKIKPDAIFIDLGGPSGHGVRDRLEQLGFKVIGIDFGMEPVGDDHTAPTFYNRRAEMAWKCAKWVKENGALPEDQMLRAELLEPEFWPAKTGLARWIVEPKDEIKTRLNRSPDRLDALWLTFAAPVLAKNLRESLDDLNQVGRQKFDPYAVLGGRRDQRQGRSQGERGIYRSEGRGEDPRPEVEGIHHRPRNAHRQPHLQVRRARARAAQARGRRVPRAARPGALRRRHAAQGEAAGGWRRRGGDARGRRRAEAVG